MSVDVLPVSPGSTLAVRSGAHRIQFSPFMSSTETGQAGNISIVGCLRHLWLILPGTAIHGLIQTAILYPDSIGLSQTDTTHKTALDSLLTLRFQLFEKAQFVTA